MSIAGNQMVEFHQAHISHLITQKFN